MGTVELDGFVVFLSALRPDLSYVIYGDLLIVSSKNAYMNFKVNHNRLYVQSTGNLSWRLWSGDEYSAVLWKPTLQHFFGPSPDEEANSVRAEPVKTSQPQDMQTTASELRQQEAALVQKHRERQKELKKVAKAFARVICEGMRAVLLNPERIKLGGFVKDVPFDLVTLDPDEVYRQLIECMADSGFNVKRDATQSKPMILTVRVN